MNNPVSESDRRAHPVSSYDLDFQRVREVLRHYGSAAGYSLTCAEDLTVLIKMSRVKEYT